MSLPTCPREDCTASDRHYHRSYGTATKCGAGVDYCQQNHANDEPFTSRCYAPRTPQPQPYRFPDGWERGHEAKYWLQTGLTPYGLTLDPERAPGVLNWLGVNYYTPDSPHLAQPAAIVLPTVKEVRRTMDDAHTWHDAAQDVLDLIAARLPAWQPVEPADVRVGDRVRVSIEGVVILTPDRRIDAADLVGLLGDEAYTQAVYLLDRPEPVDPAVAAVVEWLTICGPIDAGADDARDLLARIDAARGAL